jgi:hypothetical protein
VDVATGATTQTVFPAGPGSVSGYAAVPRIDGDRILFPLVGPGQPGVVYLFDLASGQQVDEFRAEDEPLTASQFGRAIALDGPTVVIGDYLNSSTAPGAGAAYVFDSRWRYLGYGLAGVNGKPCLRGSGDIIPGSVLTLELSDAAPVAPVIIVYGTSPSSPIYQPFKGGTLVPNPTWIIYAGFTDPGGNQFLQIPFMPVVAPGVTIYVQDWIKDAAGPAGYSASNAISMTFP